MFAISEGQVMTESSESEYIHVVRISSEISLFYFARLCVHVSYLHNIYLDKAHNSSTYSYMATCTRLSRSLPRSAGSFPSNTIILYCALIDEIGFFSEFESIDCL